MLYADWSVFESDPIGEAAPTSRTSTPGQMTLDWGMRLRRVPVVAIVGAPRSGSTLLLRILDSHSQIAAPCEIGVPTAFPEVDEKHPLVVKKWHQICAYYGVEPQRAARDPARLFRTILRREGKRLLVLKDPRASLYIAALERYRPRYVHLIRDARSVAASRMFADPSQGFGKWLAYHESALDFFSRTPRSRPVSLRYEDLIVDPEGEMRGLLAELGLRFEPTMLRFGEFPHADDRMNLWGIAASESPAESFLQHDLGACIRRAESPRTWPQAVLEQYEKLTRVRELNASFGYL